MLVTNVMDRNRRVIKVLGNIFSVNNQENFFQNSNFTALYKNFEKRFKEKLRI